MLEIFRRYAFTATFFITIDYINSNLNDREKSVFYAIAVAEENLTVLSEEDEIYTIAEEYANGGIKLLKDKVFSKEPGSFIKKFESELMGELKSKEIR